MDHFSGPWILFQDGMAIQSHDSKDQAQIAESDLRFRAVQTGYVGNIKINFNEDWLLNYGHYNKWNRPENLKAG